MYVGGEDDIGEWIDMAKRDGDERCHTTHNVTTILPWHH